MMVSICTTQHDLKKVVQKVSPNDALHLRTHSHLRSYFDI